MREMLANTPQGRHGKHVYLSYQQYLHIAAELPGEPRSRDPK